MDPEPPSDRAAGADDPGRGARHRARHRARKERVLHTRISEPLAEDIRRMADDLRVPVSNLVRNILEEAFHVVETVTDNVGDLIEDVADGAERARHRVRRRRRFRRREHGIPPEPETAGRATRAPFPDVVGWQPLILNQPRRCADCEEPIEPGDRAFAGLASTGLTDVYLCGDCIEARR